MFDNLENNEANEYTPGDIENIYLNMELAFAKGWGVTPNLQK